MIRTGIGFDFHKLVTGRKLILGGAQIEYAQGLQGHSDADVLAHAVCDALLGAAGLEDIGYYFPNTDPRYENISSLELLKEVSLKVRDCGLEIVNVDSMLLMEEPKIAPYRDQIKRNIASALNIPLANVAVKATTMEGCGTIGSGEGIAAQAIATLRRRKQTRTTKAWRSAATAKGR